MIRRIQALNYRCLRYVDVSLDRFHVLIGPNASGKSTLFDAIAFVGDLVRDGLLALTLLAYLPDNRETYLLEEPENRAHPLALEGIGNSLSSAYDAQVLLTTHSPTLLSLVEPSEILCFDKNAHGATDIVRGSEHPVLADWRGSINMAVLFAKGAVG